MSKSGYFKGELRPCPFCGCPASIYLADDEPEQYRVDCSNNECSMGFPDAWYDNRPELVIDWNNRPAFDKAIDALIKVEIKLVWKNDTESDAIINSVCELTGLSYPEALAIYHERKEI